MVTRRVHPQQVATAAMMATRLEDTGAADNFRKPVRERRSCSSRAVADDLRRVA
jgi:hypothetical protein